MVEQSLTNSNPEWVVHRYTPWAASDANGITAEFFPYSCGFTAFRQLAKIQSQGFPKRIRSTCNTDPEGNTFRPARRLAK
jgi:hypothetical protein